MSAVVILSLVLGADGAWGDSAAPTEQQRRDYAAAKRSYDDGSFDEAASAFERLMFAPTAIATVARFGLGNASVRLAQRTGAAGVDSDALLTRAVGVYRAILDAPAIPMIDRRHVRHNLELAKRLMNWSDQPTGASTRPAKSPGDPKQADHAPNDRPGAPTDAAVDPNAPRSDREDEGGEIRQPLPGIGYIEAEELTPAQAEAKLASALAKIAARKAQRLPKQPIARRPMPGDY